MGSKEYLSSYVAWKYKIELEQIKLHEIQGITNDAFMVQTLLSLSRVYSFDSSNMLQYIWNGQEPLKPWIHNTNDYKTGIFVFFAFSLVGYTT